MSTAETRRESYEAIQPQANTRRMIILEILGDREMTVSEITEELARRGITKYYDRNFAAPRVTELDEMGVIEVVDKTICSRTGRRVAVYARVGRQIPEPPHVDMYCGQCSHARQSGLCDQQDLKMRMDCKAGDYVRSAECMAWGYKA